MPLLEREPALTWALHISLLENARTYRIKPPALERLRDVDHVDVQVAIAPFL
jgi:hypothetical protein